MAIHWVPPACRGAVVRHWPFSLVLPRAITNTACLLGSRCQLIHAAAATSPAAPSQSSRCLWIWPPLLILGPANCKLQAETFPAAWRHLAHIGNQAVLQLPVASPHQPGKSVIWCLQSSGASGSSITRARAAALPWHWQRRINKRPAHRKGCISARKLDGWTATRNQPGGGAEEHIAGLLVATSHGKSPLGWMPISSRMGSAVTLDITDGRGLDATPARAQLNTRVVIVQAGEKLMEAGAQICPCSWWKAEKDN